MNEPGEIVASFGTGFLHTTIVRRGEGEYLWTRRPGPDRRDAMPTPADAVLAAVRALPPGPVAFTLPVTGDGAGLTYRTGQAGSLAGLLLRGAPGTPGAPDTAGVADTLEQTGAALARLHAVPVPRAGLDGPGGPRRLLSWLTGGDGPGAAARLHRHAARILGPGRRAAVEEWCAPGEPHGPRALLHGAPSLGTLLPLTPGRDGALLTGEDLSAGAPESDVGWLVGELVEFRELAGRFGRATLDHDALIGHVLDGYGSPLDLAAVGRAATVRFLSHVHDFAAYVRWHDILLDYLEIVAGVIDAAGAGRLIRR
ncbi:phosphotransferase [Streptosporangium sp. NPDC048865]|uniref:phosphotransferase n=1 Tax=Streptosporangium sp. NPDC048865 TaxID=3155766 RepID=UPI00342D2B62